MEMATRGDSAGSYDINVECNSSSASINTYRNEIADSLAKMGRDMK